MVNISGIVHTRLGFELLLRFGWLISILANVYLIFGNKNVFLHNGALSIIQM